MDFASILRSPSLVFSVGHEGIKCLEAVGSASRCTPSPRLRRRRLTASRSFLDRLALPPPDLGWWQGIFFVRSLLMSWSVRTFGS